MLKTRLLLGTIMAAAAGGVLYLDSFFAPYFPILFLLALGVGVFATRELVALISAENRPREWLCVSGVVLFVLLPFLLQDSERGLVGELFAAFTVVALLVEMARYRESGRCVTRVAHTLLVAAYLGLLPSLFLKIRWLVSDYTVWMLTLAIFVPKCCDIGAYAVGRIFGKHPCAPLLSPKKTWEGLAGGIAFAIATAVIAGQFVPVFRYGILEAAAFGLVVGLTGILGDLAESMIKRDGLAKDASKAVPGFGGVLDVIDSILFAGPVAYFWFRG